MKKERLFYLDFVRAIAVISIVITHFNARFLYLNPPMPEKAVLTTNVGNLYIGDWGVSLFFIISGAALMYIYQEKCDWKLFYKKRFLSIYPMFWIAYIAVFLYSFWENHAVIGGETENWRMIFSVLGFDGLLATNGYATFYLIGEWFLGVIILMYIIFPLLLKSLRHSPILLLGITMLCYLLGIFACSRISYPIVPATVLFIRLPEIVFGMFFVKQHWNVDWKVALVGMIVIIANWFLKPSFSSSVQTTYVGIASFLVLVFIANLVKCSCVTYICSVLSKYSYAIFLVHHVIIANMMQKFDLIHMSKMHSYILFLTIGCVIAFFSWLLYQFHDFVMREWKKMWAKTN